MADPRQRIMQIHEANSFSVCGRGEKLEHWCFWTALRNSEFQLEFDGPSVTSMVHHSPEHLGPMFPNDGICGTPKPPILIKRSQLADEGSDVVPTVKVPFTCELPAVAVIVTIILLFTG